MDKVVISMDGTLGWRPSRGAAVQYFGPGEAVEVPVAAAKSFGRLPLDWKEGDELPEGVKAASVRRDEAGSTPNATDAAIEFAAAEGVDLSQVKGTGEGGRIGKADVTAYLKSKEA